MRVKFLEHTDDGILHKLVFIHIVHVEIGYRKLGELKLPRRRIKQFVLRMQGRDEYADGQKEKESVSHKLFVRI